MNACTQAVIGEIPPFASNIMQVEESCFTHVSDKLTDTQIRIETAA